MALFTVTTVRPFSEPITPPRQGINIISSTYPLNACAIIINCIYCVGLFECDFENGVCGMDIGQSGSYTWTTYSGGTGSPNTGPSEGHSQSQYYVYAEASNRNEGDTTRYNVYIYSDSTRNIYIASWMYSIYFQLGSKPLRCPTLEVSVSGFPTICMENIWVHRASPSSKERPVADALACGLRVATNKIYGSDKKFKFN